MVDVNNSIDVKTTGVVINNGNGTFSGRTVTAGSTKISVANGNGTGGNPTVDAVPANFDINTFGSPPLTVVNGGTGLTSITDHSVVIGSGATAVTPIAVGATGELLTGVTGADPAFAAISSGDFTFTTAAAGATRTLNVSNTGVGAANTATVAAGSANSDPQFCLTSGVVDWTIQADQSDSASFKLHHGAGTAGPQIMRVDNATNNTNWNYQCCFLAGNDHDTANMTGDGTMVTPVKFMGTSYDVGSPYNPVTGLFTAPITGTYQFICSLNVLNIGAGHNNCYAFLATTSMNYWFFDFNPSNMRDVNTNLVANGIVMVRMSAGDTAQVNWKVDGSTKTVGLGGNSYTATYFQGFLLG